MDRRRTPRERRRVAAGSLGAVVSIALLVGASPAAADSTWPVPIPRPPVPRTFTPPHLGTPSATPHTGTAQPTPQTTTPGNSSTPRRPRLTPSTAPGVTTLPSTQPTAPVPTPPPSEPSGAPTLTITPTSEPTGDGTVSVLALDSDTGQPVRGAALYVTDRNGRRTIVTPSSITVPAGEVTITASDAPGGYRYEGSLFRSGLVEPGKISSFTFQLRRKPVGGGSINAVARNRVTGAPLRGAAFTVETCTGDFMDTVFTGADGIAPLAGLPAGCYSVTETGTPTGFVDEADTRRTTVANGRTATVTVYDLPTHYRVVRDPTHRVPVRSVPTGRGE
ncbi:MULTISPECIES: MSCRAMM family protein [Gordonia]|uniref:MSCRAMM family protein n=1 Tax=Gordonia TaxID=2053 RepID=UPI0030FED4E3